MKKVVQHGADNEIFVTHLGARVTFVEGNATSDVAHLELCAPRSRRRVRLVAIR